MENSQICCDNKALKKRIHNFAMDMANIKTGYATIIDSKDVAELFSYLTELRAFRKAVTRKKKKLARRAERKAQNEY